jgi:hypothetical protein
MANKSLRIPTSAGGNDKYVTIKLENEVDFYEVLSLQINQKDIYGSFNSDYGVIIGRVIANGGVGIPNAKISIFIPITDEDKTNGAIYTIYPYTSPRDKDINGVRYNLLPRVGVNNPFLVVGEYAPKVPIGTFPTKEEITTNPTHLQVYEKYYKFTTITNQSGDYMIFGAPVGVQTVHMSVDITDIGKYSMTPGTMITQLGYSPNLFDQNGTAIKFSTDLDTLPNVETQEVAVDVRPFWGDTENFEIGITRQDFKIRATLINSFIVFGSAFTDGISGLFGRGGSNIKQLYTMFGGDPSPFLSIDGKRNGIIHEKIMYVPNTVPDSDISGGTLDVVNDFKELVAGQYTSYLDKGVFVYDIPCNRRKVITDDSGNEVEVDANSNEGVFTEFNGFFVFDYSDATELPMNRADEYNGHVADSRRIRFKVPQETTITGTALSIPSIDDVNHKAENDAWRKQTMNFKGGEFYSVARYHGTANSDDNSAEGYTTDNWVNNTIHYFTSGHIFTNSLTGTSAGSPSPLQLITNGNAAYDNTTPLFAAEWLNFSLYFPQYTNYSGLDSNTARRSRLLNADNRFNTMFDPNSQLIAGTLKDTSNLGRSDIHPTKFINVPKTDILKIINYTESGALSSLGFRNGFDPPFNDDPLTGTDYKSESGTVYLYKGLGSVADIFTFMRGKNII